MSSLFWSEQVQSFPVTVVSSIPSLELSLVDAQQVPSHCLILYTNYVPSHCLAS